MMCSPASLSTSAGAAAASAAAAWAAGIGGAGAAGAAWTTCAGGALFPSMRSRVPACSTSTAPMPRSATLSINSRMSFRFNVATSDQFVSKKMLRLRQLEPRPPVITVGAHHQQDVVLGRDRREEGDVFLGDERELQHVAGVEIGVGKADRLNEAAELGAHDVERHVVGLDRLDGDPVEADQAHRERAVDAVA